MPGPPCSGQPRVMVILGPGAEVDAVAGRRGTSAGGDVLAVDGDAVRAEVDHRPAAVQGRGQLGVQPGDAGVAGAGR